MSLTAPASVVAEFRKLDEAVHRKARNAMQTIPDGPRELEPYETQTRSWPELSPVVFHGPVGRFVRLVEPETEADPAAMLLQFLVLFGNIIGRTAYFLVEGARHYSNIFVLIIGLTSKSRKGTSLNYPLQVFQRIDEDYVKKCLAGGMSSGEGVIAHVRDPREEKQAIKEKGRVIDYQVVVVDGGVEDKRACLIETEMASVTSRMKRESNSLSAVIRQIFDTGNLAVITKGSPLRATGAHISIIGHVTEAEHRRIFDDTQLANGFINRFLHVMSRRSKCLPLGGDLLPADLNDIVSSTQKAAAFARSLNRVTFDADATALWIEKYPVLSEGRPGMLGAATSRAEAYVLRLSLIYALLDCSSVIQRDHLIAALALWQYCEDSARYVYGDALGDKLADEILGALREAADTGLTRSQIRDLFRRNVDADCISGALKCLAEHGLAHTRKEPSDGRPVERWLAAPRAAVAPKPYVVEPAQLSTREEIYFPPGISDDEADQISREALGVISI
ncbi:MAG TPA: DUF3987 domain-containing protein [Pyrinomonadaceae bacterium]|nr:DUF3987 domain-containing protein [Pyrinomonadaceae bacterium]